MRRLAIGQLASKAGSELGEMAKAGGKTGRAGKAIGVTTIGDM